ncbi:hypothetical protein EFS27_03420 [Leuconostoc mesenteroides]|uniref:PD-(D/E)XK nuclease-like domain-containing protein n=1 Tax=Leuconostoc mesenteroides TaxID=1245 RepID=UPI0021A3F4CF|nr:PD-(D/E)XK nuclease-like domain-containing protein [Leuconostoc mesenteroides]MCT3038349.1 hypothetical protein [Leuconostoc mesenteroides]
MTIHMSPTRALKFNKNPLRALEDYKGINKWWEGNDDALHYGNIVHNLAEGRRMLKDFTDDDKKVIISSTGKTKGQLKSTYKDAITVGNKLRNYVLKVSHGGLAQFEVSIDELVNLEGIEFNATGRADMITADVVYDFKTVSPQDFDGFLNYKSFRDGHEKDYLKQISYYASMFDKKEAHILYIKKDKNKPFIYDYQLSSVEINAYASEMIEEIEEAVKVVAGEIEALAVNDGSQWAYKHFGGVINDN